MNPISLFFLAVGAGVLLNIAFMKHVPAPPIEDEDDEED
jgi:hypothetical protein